MAYPPTSWPFPTPNPPIGDVDQDQTPRFGEGTPLPVKMADYYPGKSAGIASSVTVSSAAVQLPRNSFAVSAFCQVQGYPIRYSTDGVPPTATTGFRADPGDILHVTGPEDLASFLMIREGSSDATVVVQPFT